MLRQAGGRDQESSPPATPGAVLIWALSPSCHICGFVQGRGRLPPEVGDKDLPPVAHVEDLDGPV